MLTKVKIECIRGIFILLIGIFYCKIMFFKTKMINSYTAFPEIPRIDIHSHLGNNLSVISMCLKIREFVKEIYTANIAMWINVGHGKETIENPEEIESVSQHRILNCISDYEIQGGNLYPSHKELPQWKSRGIVGYKIWIPSEKGPYIDNYANTLTFSKMAELNIPLASVHIADPYGTYGNRMKWFDGPVEYWRQILSWRSVLEKHPKLISVCAHMMWLCSSDDQLDFLRYMLVTFPNLFVDLAATFQYFHLIQYDNLREFMIDYSDRILFGTDIDIKVTNYCSIKEYAMRYKRCFLILETSKVISGTFHSRNKIKGLALPREVLENIYYKNAIEIYPRLKTGLQRMGYAIDQKDVTRSVENGLAIIR